MCIRLQTGKGLFVFQEMSYYSVTSLYQTPYINQEKTRGIQAIAI